MYNWTDEQLEAINASGTPVIVSAAAGSGKTAVLVERTIRLLCDKSLDIPADRLLAVTFTVASSTAEVAVIVRLLPDTLKRRSLFVLEKTKLDSTLLVSFSVTVYTPP